MHLLSTQAADGSDVEAAVDLGQTPGELVFISAADSDLACLAAAQARLGPRRPQPAPRQPAPARPPALGRPLCRAGRVAAPASCWSALLGGRGYWPYGLEQVAACCAERGIALACLPGDERADPELTALSTLPPEAHERFGRYLQHGGIDNAEQALRYAAALIGRPADWSEPLPLPRAGLYRPAPADIGPARCTPGVLPRTAAERRSRTDRRAPGCPGRGRALRHRRLPLQPEGPRRSHAGSTRPSPACAPT